MKLGKDLVPIISKKDMDEEAAKFLLQYCPQALEKPMAVPVEDVAELKMNLEIDYVHIEAGGNTLGMMIFSDGPVELYDKETGRYTRRLYKKGTLLVERDLSESGNRGRERFTIAHEMVHWDKHRLRFMMHSLKDKTLARACRCPREKTCRAGTPEEWMEWQADNLAAAILMPAEMYKRKAEEFSSAYKALEVLKGSCRCVFASGMIRHNVISDLANTFQVSRQAAEIRLNVLGVAV